MDPLLAFLFVIICITIVSIWYRLSPFFILIGGAILFGLLVGMAPDVIMEGIVDGVGKVFSAFGIIILCGAVITKLLQEQDQISDIVGDIRGLIKNTRVIAGFTGYLLSVPITCCITAYIMLQPIFENLENDRKKRNVLLYLAATGSIISYALIYPTPVNIPLYTAFSAGISPVFFDALTLPLSLLLLGGTLLYFWYLYPDQIVREIKGTGTFITSKGNNTNPVLCSRIHFRAWAPFVAIIIAIPIAFLILHLSHIGMINFIMLVGVITAIALSPSDIRSKGISQGAKHAGLIIFDICGAGALGYVIVGSGFAQNALDSLSLFIPVLCIPFILAALIETAQGSRVVTAVITAQVLSGSTIVDQINPITLILLISAGSCLISYVTDPYFWLVHQTTGDDMKTVVQSYTIPIALSGIGIFLVAVILEYLI